MVYNTRIAPSNSGRLHIGNARTAYFNYLAARASGGIFLLRIDDTDAARSKSEYVDTIKETMEWLGLDYDVMFFQSERQGFYVNYLKHLTSMDCTRQVENGAVALHLPPGMNYPTEWTDEVVGKVKITERDLESTEGMILVRADGTPTYNFASVVDDFASGVNFIIRGTDHITNTAKQAILFYLFGFHGMKYAHVGLIGMGGKPLSKRDGAASMLYYREKGYDPDAMLNFMGRLGWSPTKDDKSTAVLPRERMLEMFLTQGKMRAQMANLDLAKLESFDRKYKAQKGIWRNGTALI